MFEEWTAIPIIHEWFIQHGLPLHLKAALYGFLSSISLVLGSVLGIYFHPIDPKATAFVVAFGAGALIFAVSTEMYAEALHRVEVDGTGSARIEIGISMTCAVIGAVCFTLLNIKLEQLTVEPYAPTSSRGEEDETDSLMASMERQRSLGASPLVRSKSFKTVAADHASSSHAALAMWLGVALDGIPESVLIGFITNEMMMTVAFLVSIFVANFPEAFASASMLTSKGWKPWKIVAMWSSLCLLTTLLSGAASYFLFFMSSPEARAGFRMAGAGVEGLAGGAMLAMVASAMLPEAFHTGGSWAGVFTVLGFLFSCTVKVFFGRVPGEENARKAIIADKAHHAASFFLQQLH